MSRARRPSAVRPPSTYLEFERPLAAIDAEIAALAARRARRQAAGRLRALRAARRRLERDLVRDLTPWQRVQLARHPDRPSTLDYVRRLCTQFVELHGDRRFGDDGAVVGGLARFAGRAVVIVGHQRGRTPAERIARNFGMARPEGYRKAVRLFELAARFRRPVLTFVDTQGAYPGIGAEERGQAEAIAACLTALGDLGVPVVSALIGEGGSGGALALAVADRVVMQEHAWYSVISPEGCASILFRRLTPATVARSAALLRLTAEDLLAAKVVDDVVAEPGGAAHRDPAGAAATLGRALERHLNTLVRRPARALVAHRYARYRRFAVDLPPV